MADYQIVGQGPTILLTPGWMMTHEVWVHQQALSADFRVITWDLPQWGPDKSPFNLDLSRVPDGIYRGRDFGYKSEIEIEVTVRAGRIETVRVTREREHITLSSLSEIPRRILKEQNLRDIDAVSGATMAWAAAWNRPHTCAG